MLAADGLTVALGGQEILRQVSFSVEEGCWLAVIGANGAGKSTLLRALAGLIEHDGELRIGGRQAVASRREAARLVAMVPQRPVLPPAMTITDYVLLGRSSHHSLLGADTSRDRRVVAAVLHRLELTKLAGRPLGQVSGGEAQRAVLARALAQEAPILLLDEPTSSLDLGNAQLVLELTDSLRREHSLTVVSAIHDLTTAAQYADRLLLLSEGTVVLSGTPAEVLSPSTVARYFGALVEVLPGCSGPVVAPHRPSAKSTAAPRRPAMEVS